MRKGWIKMDRMDSGVCVKGEGEWDRIGSSREGEYKIRLIKYG